jgi:cytochrome c-type biogenesis protein CcsB
VNSKSVDLHPHTDGVPSLHLLHWIVLSIVMLCVTGLAIYFEAGRMISGTPLEGLMSYQLTSYSNLLLAVSTVLYIAHLRLTTATVGKWATGMAMLGVVGALGGLLTRWFEVHQVPRALQLAASSLYEVTILFSAVTVMIYLAMEFAYRNRSAGAFVMPIVMCAVGFEIWLVSNGQASPHAQVPALKGYWMNAHILANFVGYGSFAVAAGMGAMYLLRDGAESAGRKDVFPLRVLPGLCQIDRLIFRAIAIGFPVFTLAMVLGATWAHEVWGRYWSWEPKETWTLIVWITYAVFIALRLTNGWAGVRMAWWAILGFALTLFSFVGVNLLHSGLHAFGSLG